MQPGKKIDLFVMAGQSNMQGLQGDAAQYPPDAVGVDQRILLCYGIPAADGMHFDPRGWGPMRRQFGLFPAGHFGPEVTFARRLAQEGYSTAIFKYSAGSTSIAEHWKAPGDGGAWDHLLHRLATARNALVRNGYTVTIRCLVWIQGESDAQFPAMAHRYRDGLKTLIEDFRTRMSRCPTTPVILCVDEQHPYVVGNPEVLQAQHELARTMTNVGFVSMLGLEKADVSHLTPAGLQDHGDRLFNCYKSLASSADDGH